MLNQFHVRNNCETEAKFIQGRIHSVEQNIKEFCKLFSQYSHKAARIRDKGDELAKFALNYAKTESISKSLATGLEGFADSVSIISDYGDVRVYEINLKVVSQFAKYEEICKIAKEEVKGIYNVRDKEMMRRKQLDKIRERNPRNRQQIIQAETDLVKATAEVSKSIHSLEDKTNSFEKQKLHDVKSILLDFIIIEIGYHSKCLEVLTKAYNEVDSINEESDLEEFKKSLLIPDTVHYKSSRTSSLFQSSNSLGSLGMILSPAHNKRTPGIPSSKARLAKSEDTLDSMKHSVSDSEDGHESDSEENTSTSNKSNRNSPVLVRRYKK